MSPRFRAAVSPLLVPLVLLLATSVAWAQDYTKTNSLQSLYETRPSGATRLDQLSTETTDSYEIVDLPFEFAYYGRLYAQAHVGVNGCILMGNVGAVINTAYPGLQHGQDATSGAFPYTPTTGGAGVSDMDGVIAPMWQIHGGINMSGYTGAVWTWTVGTAPSRVFVVSWEDTHIGSTTACTIQVHFYEGTGRIAFVYAGSATAFSGSSGVIGLDSPGDARYFAPGPNSRFAGASPGSVYFDPRTVTFTGRVQYDKLVSDASGIGNSVQSSRDLAGLVVELRRDGGIPCAHGRTASDGTFSVPAYAVASSSAGTFELLAESRGARVSLDGTGATTSWTPWTSVSYAADANLGSAVLTSDDDPAASVRAAFNVALACGAAHDYVAPRVTASIPVLDVALDDNAAATTTFVPAGGSPALLTIGGSSSANPDAWDDAIVTKAYAWEVLSRIAGNPSGVYEDRFDGVTGPETAFADGFGYALWTAVSGSTTAVDGTGPSKATVRDLESPALTTTPGPSVTGSVAAALVDLVDGANETRDPVDGTPAPDRFLLVADAETSAPTVATFLQGWVDQGWPGEGITRVFIANGVLADDDAEPNDSPSETAALGDVGVRRDLLVLNRFNEDWYSVTLPAAAPALFADVTYDRPATTGTIEFVLVDGAGDVVATGTASSSSSPIHLASGSLGSGVRRLGVRHTGGATIGSYGVQAYLALDMAAQPFAEWTEGVPYDRSLAISGGVPPYQVTTIGASPLPPGLGVNPATLRGTGVPSEAGSFPVTLELRDSGSPANSLNRSQTIRINAPVDLALPAWVGFPLGADVSSELPHSGGTAPLALAVAAGSLPDGLAIAAGTFRVEGSATTAGSAPLTLHASDSVGSADDVETTAVVCPRGAARNTLLDLAEGDAACGFWIDAVHGSALKFSVKTAKKAAKRPLTVTVLAPDRSVVAGGKVRTKSGLATGKSIPCDLSGRYYVVLSSAAGAATRLVAGTSAAAPKSGKGKFAEFAPTDVQRIDVGALPGARLTFKASADRKRDLVARCVGLQSPAGTLVPILDSLKTTATGFTLAVDLDQGGTWTVILAADPRSQETSPVTWSFKVKQPKGAAYVAE